MNTETGEIKEFETELDLAKFIAGHKDDWRKTGGVRWLACKVEPTKEQKQSGVKGWHDCLCGSGKKFRDCCRACKCGSGKLARECCRGPIIYKGP